MATQEQINIVARAAEADDPTDQVREALIHGSYFSAKDIEFCADLDIADEFSSHQYFTEIESLHQSLQALMPETEELESIAIA